MHNNFTPPRRSKPLIIANYYSPRVSFTKASSFCTPGVREVTTNSDKEIPPVCVDLRRAISKNKDHPSISFKKPTRFLFSFCRLRLLFPLFFLHGETALSTRENSHYVSTVITEACPCVFPLNGHVYAIHPFPPSHWAGCTRKKWRHAIGGNAFTRLNLN